ncbi:TniQ family protein [Microbacterium aurantiacum]|uniref:TniQ family protein n=1 Tax=Microbacterium aurantiacum TaxID=162393 RepID=UPI003436CC7D
MNTPSVASAAAAPRELRVLPFRIVPLPDEPFDSWFETLAHTYQATPNELATALGLTSTAGGTPMSSSTANSWATALTTDQLEMLEQTTGVPAPLLAASTRMEFATHAIRITRAGRISSFCPATGTAGRYCPECLADSGGRWRLSWQFPFGFACPRHRRLLVDVCPGCGKPPRQIGHPLDLVPEPGRCHNRVSDAEILRRARRCRTDLTVDTGRIAAPEAVREAQRIMLAAVSRGHTSAGLYADDPQPTLRALEDVRLLARITRDLAARGEIDTAPLGPDVTRAFLIEAEGPHRGVSLQGAATVAVGTTLAWNALADRRRVVALLRGRLAESTSYSRHTPQLQELIAASFGRTRRPTTVLQSSTAARCDDPARRARKVPAQLWPDWTELLAPTRVDRVIAASALSAAVVFTGTRLTHAAALGLIDPDAPTRQVTNVMRELGRGKVEDRTLLALVRLAAYLDSHDTPIDYARRRALDCINLLPEEQWWALCEEANVAPGAGRRWRLARTHLYAMITGNAVRSAPWSHRDLTASDVRTFAARLPRTVKGLLDGAGAAFLRERGIDEPVAWAPPAELATGITPDSVPASEIELRWPPARPARGRLARTVEAARIADAYESGMSTFEIAAKAGVSRQTISRVLAHTGTPTRRGRSVRIDVDPEWLRTQYVTERRTIPEIAALAGCSPMTINRRIRDAGIPLRQVGAGSEAPSLHPHELAGTSPLLQKVMTGRHAVTRARRFLLIAQAATVAEVAADLGVSPTSMGAQLKRLANLAGGPLVNQAERGRPLTLTPLGKRLAKELHSTLP